MTACHDISGWEPQEEVAPIRFHHIVVGVDGSPNSLAALRLAVGLGFRDDATVEAVCAYRPHLTSQYPFSTVLPPYGPAGEGFRDPYAITGGAIDAAADAQTTLEHALREVFNHSEMRNVVLRPTEGPASEVLTRMAARADLLVVGARGHSGALGLLLGSTAQDCVKHAPCAVLVVPAPVAAEADKPDADRNKVGLR